MTNCNKLVYMPVTNDYIFKKIFCNPNKTKYFANFYESIFNRKVKTIEILENTKMKKTNMVNKMVELDSLAIINGEYVHIEMQRKVKVGIEKRIEFYPSKILSQVVKSGTEYEDIKKIRSIWIFEKTINKADNIYMDKIKKIYAKRCKEIKNQIVEITIIELEKVDKINKNDMKNGKKIWLNFIKAKEVEEVEAIRKINPIIDEAVKNECMETKELSEIWSRIWEEETERQYITEINYAKRKGRKEGERKGRKEGEVRNKVNVILTMNKLNFTFDVISQVVNLPKAEVISIVEKERYKSRNK